MPNPTPTHMKQITHPTESERTNVRISPVRLLLVTGLLCAATPWRAFGASQTWTNAPVDATWVNTNNWVASASPGAVNLTGNTVNNDIATFNTPTASGIGSEANPIVTDNATTINTTR